MAKVKNTPLPKHHYEEKYDVNAPSKPLKKDGGDSFNPRSGQKREATHKKVNKEDY